MMEYDFKKPMGQCGFVMEIFKSCKIAVYYDTTS